MVQATTPGTTVPVKVYRDSKLMSVNIKSSKSWICRRRAPPPAAATNDAPRRRQP